MPTKYSKNSYSAIKFVLLILIQSCTLTRSSSTEENQFRPYGIQITICPQTKTVETLARIPEGGKSHSTSKGPHPQAKILSHISHIKITKIAASL